MPRNHEEQSYDTEEARLRFEAALRGARAAEPLPMKNIPSTRRSKKDKDAAQKDDRKR